MGDKQDISKQTREKQESNLLSSYDQGIEHLHNQRYPEGIDVLRRVLQNKIIQEEEFNELRYCILQSLAGVFEKQDMINEALHYYHKSVKIKVSDYQTWLKLGVLCRKEGYLAQSEFCLQRCLVFMPGTAYQNIIYEQLTYLSFLSDDYDSALNRIEYLQKSEYKASELFLLKALIHSARGEENLRKEAILSSGRQLEEDSHPILKEKLAIRAKQIININKMVGNIANKQEEFSIKLEKLTWNNFFKVIKYITALFVFNSKGENLTAKYKKAKLSHYIESVRTLSVCNTVIVVREKRETFRILKPSESDEVEGEPQRKEKKNTKASKAPKPNNKTKNKKTTLQPAKASTRLQKNVSEHSKDKDTDSLVVEIADKKDVDIGEILRDMKKFVYDELQKDHYEDFFDRHFHVILTKEPDSVKKGDIDLNLNINQKELFSINLQNVMHPTQVVEATQKGSLLFSPNRKTDEKPQDEAEAGMEIQNDEVTGQDPTLNDINSFVKKYMNEDFNSFFSCIKLTKSANLIVLIEKILTHFLETKARQIPRRLEELACFSFSQHSLSFCPSFLISDEIKEIIIKLYLYSCHFCKDPISDPLSLITLFEILTEHYVALLANPELSSKKKQKILFLRKKLSQIAFEFLNKGFKDLEGELGAREICALKLRSYHILGFFYSQKEFESACLVKQCIFHLEREMNEYLRFRPEEPEQDNDIILNLFWMNCKSLKRSVLSQIEERIDDNGSNQDHQNSQFDANMKNFEEILLKYINSFEDRISCGQSLEDAVELYYKKIVNLIRAPSLNFGLYLRVFHKLLLVYLGIIGPKPYPEDHRKVIVRTYEQLKIETLLKLMLDFLKREDFTEISSSTSEETGLKIYTETTIVMLKVFIINLFIVEFINNSLLVEVLLRLTLHLLEKKGKIQIDVVFLKCQFFRFLHLIVDISPESTLSALHKSLSFCNEFRNQLITDYMEQTGKYEKDAETLNDLSRNTQKEKKGSKEGMLLEDQENQEDLLKEYARDFKEEVYKYFYCWYGVNIPSAKKPDFLPEYTENKNAEIVISSLGEIVVFMRFIKDFYPEYIENPNSKIKSQIQNFLVKTYEFLKKNDEKYNRCENFQKIFKEYLGRWLEQESAEDLNRIIDLPNIPSNCFCSKNCFDSYLHEYFYKQVFYLVGRAFEDYKIPATVSSEADESKRQKMVRENLKKAKMMYQMNICFHPTQMQSWIALAKVYLEFSFMQYDASVVERLNQEKDAPGPLVNFKGSNGVAKRILRELLLKKLKSIDEEQNKGVLEQRRRKEIIYDSKVFYFILLLLEIQEVSDKMYLEMDEDAERSLLKKKKKLIEAADSIEIAGEEEIRVRLLSILFIKRKLSRRFSLDTNYEILKSITIIKTTLQKLSAGTTATPLGGQNPLFSLPFKPEGYDFEMEIEFFITVWKILKKFCLILSIVKGIIRGAENEKNLDNREYLVEIEELLRSKYKIKDFESLNDLIYLELDDHIDTIFSQESLLAPDDVSNLPARSQDSNTVRSFIENRKTAYGMKIGQSLANVLTSLCEKHKQKLVEGKIEKNAPEKNEQILRKLEHLTEALTEKLQNMTFRFKKFKTQRAYTHLCYYAAKLSYIVNKDSTKALKILDELTNQKTNELVELYKQEKDPLLTMFYHRNSFFMIQKYRVAFLKTKICFEAKDLERLKIINRKLFKLMLYKEENTDMLNLLYFKMYLISLGNILDLIKKSIKQNGGFPNSPALQKKSDMEIEGNSDSNDERFLFELLQNNIKNKTVSKLLERKPDLLDKLKKVTVLTYVLRSEAEEKEKGKEVENKEEQFEKAVSYLEKKFKKRTQKKKAAGGDNKGDSMVQE